YYDDPHDMKVMVAAIRRTMDIAAHWPGNRKLGALNVPPFLAEKHGYREGSEPSDALLEEFALHFSLTVYHPTSTCRIGDVVDPRLRVFGVGKLRVADASVMPAVIGGNTNAPFGSGFSATIASVVISSPATDAASWRACRTTLVGSMIPAWIMSVNSPFCAS